MAIDLSPFKYNPLYSDKNWGAKNNDGLDVIQNELNNLWANKAGYSAYAALLSTVQDMQGELDDKAGQAATQAALDALEAGKANLVHTHDGQDPSTMAVMVGDAAGRPTTGTLIYYNTGDGALELIEDGAVGAVLTGLGDLPALPVTLPSRILNRNYDIWQEGPGGSALLGSGSIDYRADMWFGSMTASLDTFVSAGRADAPPGVFPGDPKYVFQVAKAGGDDLTAGVMYIGQRMESVRTWAGKTVAVGVTVYGPAYGSVAMGLRQYFGSGGSAEVIIPHQAFNLVGGTPSRLVGVFEVPSIAGKTLGSGDYLELRLFLFADATAAAALGLAGPVDYQTAPLQIGGWQDTLGGAEGIFWPPDPAGELRRCQRYFRKSYRPETVPGTATSAGQIRNQHALPSAPAANNVTMSINLPEPMRATPTVTVYTTGGVAGKVSAYTTEVTPSFSDVSSKGFTLSASLTPGGPYSDVHFHYVLDARF